MADNNDKTFIPASPSGETGRRSRRLQEGSLLGEYNLVSLIGQGGLGVVYKAYQKTLNRHVALKVLKREFSGSTEYISRFKNEAQHAANMRHPNIVQVYGIGEEDNFYYFIMELVTGRTLREIVKQKKASLLKSQRALPLEKSLAMVLQIAEGLKYAHGEGIIHRDIKPSNIIEDEKTKRMMIADFGLARPLQSKAKSAGEKTAGTPIYMAPEIFEGKDCSVKSDIYALGATFYEMLAGQPVYRASDLKDLIGKLRSEDIVPPHRINKEIPAEISAIAKRCLEKDPAKRYFSVDLFIEDINTYKSKGRSSALESYERESSDPLTAESGNKKSLFFLRLIILVVGAIIVVLTAKEINLYKEKRKKGFDEMYCKKQMQIAKNYFAIKREDLAMKVLKEVAARYPHTPYAAEAENLLRSHPAEN
jgi:serine/threonine protein kinase